MGPVNQATADAPAGAARLSHACAMIARPSVARTRAEATDLREDELVLLPPGTGVEVRNRFDGSWAKGFEVVEVDDEGYRVLRCSDRSLLPRTFSDEEVRRTRKTSSMWWV